MEGQKAVLNGGYFAARTDIKFSEWEKEGVEMAAHAAKALGVDSFWELDVGSYRIRPGPGHQAVG